MWCTARKQAACSKALALAYLSNCQRVFSLYTTGKWSTSNIWPWWQNRSQCSFFYFLLSFFFTHLMLAQSVACHHCSDPVMLWIMSSLLWLMAYTAKRGSNTQVVGEMGSTPAHTSSWWGFSGKEYGGKGLPPEWERGKWSLRAGVLWWQSIL